MPKHLSHTAKLKPIFFYGLLAVLILTLLAGTTPVYARNQTPERLCKISMGEWDSGKETCTITKENFLKKFSLPRWILYVGKYCGESNSTTIVLKYKENLEAYAVSCGPLSQDVSGASLRSQG